MGNLLEFRLKIKGIRCDLGDAMDYRPLPKIALQDGKRVSVIGSFDDSVHVYFATFNFTPQVNRVRYHDRSLANIMGAVNAANWLTIVKPVPAPTSLALFVIGLKGISFTEETARIVDPDD